MQTSHQTKPPSLLMTGFGTFPGVENNYSFNLAQNISQNLRNGRLGESHSRGLVNAVKLSVEWQTIEPSLMSLYKTYQPTLSVHFGVCHTATGLILERTARNTCDPDVDASGCHPTMAAVCDDGIQIRHTQLPIEAFAYRLTGGDFKVEVSADAGRYLCNAAYFISLREAATQNQPCDALFVHIPADLNPSSSRWETMVQTATQLVADALATQRTMCG